MMITGASGALPLEILQPVLESLGSSLASAIPCCRSIASAAEQGDAAAFRPMTLCKSTPSPGDGTDIQHELSRCGNVARMRRPDLSWREIAQAMVHGDQGAWKPVPLTGAVPSHRQSLALCGAPGRSEKVVLYGGNTSRRVAGNWQPSRALCIADLPSASGAVNFTSLDNINGQPWPSARWGATLTQTTAGALLWGGWSRENNANAWILQFRESCPDWKQLPVVEGPSPTAFHTATGLPDGKRVAVVGGLGDGSSHDGVWAFQSDTGGRQKLCEGGPAPAGHVAAVDHDSQRLLLCFGVNRSPDSLNGDSFLETMNVLDLRTGRWDNPWKDREQVCKPGARRNPAGVTLGRHFIISGGYSEEQFATLGDTWAFDMRRGTWKLIDYKGAPQVEGHKAIASGLDIFTFGGHKLLGRFEGQDVAVHKLEIGQKKAASDLALSTSDSDDILDVRSFLD